MKQSKVESLVEALVNTFIGFMITMIALPLVNYICGIKMNFIQASSSTVIFTIISILRGYIIRRFFNNLYTIKHWIINKVV
jgi:hypothetical protein